MSSEDTIDMTLIESMLKDALQKNEYGWHFIDVNFVFLNYLKKQS